MFVKGILKVFNTVILRFKFFIGIFIVAAKRTPFGTYGGKFVKTTATVLGEVAAKAALTAGNVNPEIVDHVIFGHVLQVNTFNSNIDI